jgi:hypothetical protein
MKKKLKITNRFLKNILSKLILFIIILNPFNFLKLINDFKKIVFPF